MFYAKNPPIFLISGRALFNRYDDNIAVNGRVEMLGGRMGRDARNGNQIAGRRPK
jgi:hypothetical protein